MSYPTTRAKSNHFNNALHAHAINHWNLKFLQMRILSGKRPEYLMDHLD